MSLKGWFAFLLKELEHAQWILQRNLCIGSASMALKSWSPLFDASRENLDVAPIWVWLPGLPQEYWPPKILKDIGNSLGEFLEVDVSFESSREMTMARILVSMDVKEGLAKDMEIERGPLTLIKKLDNEGVPFHYRQCHQYGHMAVHCHLPFRSRVAHPKIRDSSKHFHLSDPMENIEPSQKSRRF